MSGHCLWVSPMLRWCLKQHRALPAWLASHAWNHLSRCHACRRRYNAAVYLARVGQPDGADPSVACAAELALWADRVLAPKQRTTARVRLLLPAMATAMLLLAVVWGAWQRHSEPEFSVRSAGQPQLRLRAFCETPHPDGSTTVVSVSHTPGPQEVAACRAGDTLRFALASEMAGYLYAWVRMPGQAWRWLTPNPDAAGPERVYPSQMLVPLGVTHAHQDANISDVDVLLVVDPAADSRARLEAQLSDTRTKASFSMSVLRRVHFAPQP